MEIELGYGSATWMIPLHQSYEGQMSVSICALASVHWVITEFIWVVSMSGMGSRSLYSYVPLLVFICPKFLHLGVMFLCMLFVLVYPLFTE